MILVALFLLTACSEAISGNHPKLVEANRANSKDSILVTCQALKEDAQEIREEGYSAINRADMIREQAYRVKDEAYVIKESALLEKSGLEIFLVETFALMKNQATANNLYIQEIRASLSSVVTRMESLELGQAKGDDWRQDFGADRPRFTRRSNKWRTHSSSSSISKHNLQ